MTTSIEPPRSESVIVRGASSGSQNANGRDNYDDDVDPWHRSSIVIDKRPSFHIPVIVLAFFREELDDESEGESPRLTTTSRSTTFDDDDSHSSPEEQRQPHAKLSQQYRASNDEGEQRDSEIFLSPTRGSACNHKDDKCMSHTSLCACLDMLSSHDLDLNRVGLQRLFLLTRSRTLFGVHQSEAMASNVLVHGGSMGSFKDRLRYAFATMICDAPHADVVQRTSSIGSINSSRRSDGSVLLDNLKELMSGLDKENDANQEDDKNCDNASWSFSEFAIDAPQGKSRGALHLQGLKVLANALTHVFYSILDDRHDKMVDESYASLDAPAYNQAIPLHDSVWRNVICSLVHNIESNHTADITGYSLKILRLLQAIHPDIIQPLLQHTLFPHLVYLQEYGEDHLFPMIHSESSQLLRRVNYLW